MLLIKNLEAVYKNFKIIKIIMSLFQNNVIKFDTFNTDILQKKVFEAFVSYPPLQFAIPPPQVSTFIPPFFGEIITEHTQFGFYLTIGYYFILLAQAPKLLPALSYLSQISSPVLWVSIFVSNVAPSIALLSNYTLVNALSTRFCIRIFSRRWGRGGRKSQV